MQHDARELALQRMCPLLRELAHRDVLADAEQVFRISRVVVDGNLLRVQPAHPVALRRDRLLGDVDEHPRPEGLAILLVEKIRLLLRIEIVIRFSEELFALPAEQVFARAIEADEHVIAGALHEDHVGDVLHDGLEELDDVLERFPDRQRLFRRLAHFRPPPGPL